ncbi:hypothetical protein BGZ65_002329 [Modicella reniformis]|uniref:Uncharacterized protein n=1 Tax=Modicella reniformis TaxID=1440133 RepID=A0A9P6M0F5_9FUNG|nr:hypothetical protein BGZ65_002329 [Modicella reniformis]
MVSSVTRALQLPEILHAIARWIPLFNHGSLSKTYSFMYSSFHNFEDEYVYSPQNIFPCTLVSRLWNRCFTPHLYHYYIAHNITGRRWRDYERSLAFQRCSHFIRRHLSSAHFSRIEPRDVSKLDSGFPTHCSSPSEISALLKNINEFSNHGMKDPVVQMLLHNQGSQLKLLTWHGSLEPPEIDWHYHSALVNLSCLEELILRWCNVSNALLFGILSGCSGTLRRLTLKSISGFDEGLFQYRGDHNGIDLNTTTHISSDTKGWPWSLRQLKFLHLLLDHRQSHASVLLPRLCPSLETIHITAADEVLPIKHLVSSLRLNCPNLHTIHYRNDLIEDYFYPEADVYASLFKDSFVSPGLRCTSIELSKGLEYRIMEALLFHSNTLVALELGCYSGDLTIRPLNLDQMLILLVHCTNLKEVRLSPVNCSIYCIDELFTQPWRCQGLESLIMDGYKPSRGSQFSGDESNFQALVEQRQLIELTREVDRHRARPRRHPHQEYRDDGQGWFLRYGLDADAFYEALIDGDLKRRLFEHMYKTSGVRKVKYLRLNRTELFFSEKFAAKRA